MHPEKLLSLYLKQVMEARAMTVEELSSKLGYARPTPVLRWVEGRSVPPLDQLPAIAATLSLNPVDLVIGWVIENCPALDLPLRREVLERVASAYPLSTEYRTLIEQKGPPPYHGPDH